MTGPFLVVVLGGPGSGKTLLGHGLQREFSGLCSASGGDIARLALGDVAQRSPLLKSIAAQMRDKRRRKMAAKRLAEVVMAVLADGNSTCAGLIADGVRAHDIEGFEKALGAKVACVLCVECTREVMLSRLGHRGTREGDERLGLRDTTDDAGRVDAYLQRAAAEQQYLREHFGVEHAAKVHTLDGSLPPDRCLQLAVEALCTAGASVLQSPPATGDTIKASESVTAFVDWGAQLEATVSRLDRELHADGRRRADLLLERRQTTSEM